MLHGEWEVDWVRELGDAVSARARLPSAEEATLVEEATELESMKSLDRGVASEVGSRAFSEDSSSPTSLPVTANGVISLITGSGFSKGDSCGHYALLGVPRTASTSEIQAAFRAAAFGAHVDKLSRSDGQHYSAKLQRFSEAYSVLRNPTKRREYDQS